MTSASEYFPTDAFLAGNPEFKDCWKPAKKVLALWERTPLQDFVPPHSPDVALKFVAFRNPEASDAVLVVPGFNEPMLKYVQVAYELYVSGFSVFVYDHRGQGLSDRELQVQAEGRHQNGHIEDFFATKVADCVAFARGVVVPGHRRVHLLAHSMGGLVAAHANHEAPDLFHKGRVVFSAPMFETVWGKIPPGGLPRKVSNAIGAFGVHLGLGRRLPPLPGAVLDWWDPHAPIFELLSHDKRKLAWYHALRSANPTLALLGPTMGWIYECTGAQYALEDKKVASTFANPTLILTAETDSFVKASAQEAFCAAAPSCRRVVVKGAYHEVLFESEDIRVACVDAVVNWFRQKGHSGDASTIGISPSQPQEQYGGGSVPPAAKEKATTAARENIQEAGRKKFAEMQQQKGGSEQQQPEAAAAKAPPVVQSIGGVRATLTGVLELVQTSDVDTSFQPARSAQARAKRNGDAQRTLLVATAVVGAATAAVLVRSKIGRR